MPQEHFIGRVVRRLKQRLDRAQVTTFGILSSAREWSALSMQSRAAEDLPALCYHAEVQLGTLELVLG